jgi:hypothetical protein
LHTPNMGQARDYLEARKRVVIVASHLVNNARGPENAASTSAAHALPKWVLAGEQG